MITLYSGLLRNGKDLNLIRDMYKVLVKEKKNVISNVPINMDLVTKNGRRSTGEFTYLPNDKLTVPFLIEYSEKNHRPYREGETVVFIYGAEYMFNTYYNKSLNVVEWYDFLGAIKKYAYYINIEAEISTLIEREIRIFICNEVNHNTISRTLQIYRAITKWYGLGHIVGVKVLKNSNKYMRMYSKQPSPAG